MNKEVITCTVIKLNINTQTRINSFTPAANGHRKGNNHGDLLYRQRMKWVRWFLYPGQNNACVPRANIKFLSSLLRPLCKYDSRKAANRMALSYRQSFCRSEKTNPDYGRAVPLKELPCREPRLVTFFRNDCAGSMASPLTPGPGEEMGAGCGTSTLQNNQFKNSISIFILLKTSWDQRDVIYYDLETSCNWSIFTDKT